jgi:transcriptional regulator with XRE-family HTH domain
MISSNLTFAEQLKAYRRKAGLTQEELARRLSSSTETISAWERGKRYPSTQRVPLLASMLGTDVDELIQSIHIAPSTDKLTNQESVLEDLERASLVLEFPNQGSCEPYIRRAAHRAKKIKVLTIRGEKYFVGTRSLLHDVVARAKDSTIEVLILSPEAGHITDEVAEQLGHQSAEEIREKMRRAFDYLKSLARENRNLEVRCYEELPIFKILLFDEVMFVSAFIGPKNDDNAKMFRMARDGNPLFIGFERLFDELWNSSARLG